MQLVLFIFQPKTDTSLVLTLPQGSLSVGADEATSPFSESRGTAPVVPNEGCAERLSSKVKDGDGSAAQSAGAAASGLASSSATPAPPSVGDGHGGFGLVKYTWQQKMSCSAPVAGAPHIKSTPPRTSTKRTALLASAWILGLLFFAFHLASGSFGSQTRTTMGAVSAVHSVEIDLRKNTTKAVDSVDGFVYGIMVPETHCFPEVQMLFEDPATTYASSHASGLVAVTKQPSLAAGHGGHHALGHTKAPLAQRVRKVVTVGGGGGSCVTEGATADAFSMASRASGDPKVCTPRVRRVV